MRISISDISISDMRCGLMYSGYGASGGAWWARHVGLLLPHSLLPPTRIPSQQTTPVANCSPIHPEPLSPARPGSPRRCTPEKAKFGEIRVSAIDLERSTRFIPRYVCPLEKVDRLTSNYR
jgi:hypothetical protein